MSGTNLHVALLWQWSRPRTKRLVWEQEWEVKLVRNWEIEQALVDRAQVFGETVTWSKVGLANVKEATHWEY